MDRGQSVGEVAALGREALLRFEVGPALVPTEISTSGLDPAFADVKSDLIQAVDRLDSDRARAVVDRLFEELEGDSLRSFTLEVSEEVGEPVGQRPDVRGLRASPELPL